MSSPQPVQVPTLGGLNQKAAEEALTREGLIVGTITKASSETTPADHVIGSSPAAGAPVASGTAVDLEVSSGPVQVAVPNVVGLTQVAAEAALRSAGVLPGKVTTVSNATTPTGNVAVVNPAAGTRVASGSTVDLEVSSGPDQILVPNVTGSTQAAAETTLKAAGLVPGSLTAVSSAMTPKGNVTAASPAPGTHVAPGSTVNLEVSSGPAQIAVPSVIGLNRLAADALLRSTGLVPGSVTHEASSAVAAGGVSSQHPPSGTLTSAGDTVNIEVSTGVKSVWVSRIPAILFTLLGAILLGIIIWGLSGVEGGFLNSLANEENARGLITFLIAITTVGIAVILALSTIALEDSPENEERFDRGKQVLTMLIGVLGTIVGFYFGAATDSESSQQTLSISTQSLPAGAVNNAYQSTVQGTGGMSPFTWTVTPALPADVVLDQDTGVLSGTPKSASRTELTFVVRDGSAPAKSATKLLTLEIK
jgi:beta-lactam-binding protein with PASTA domain